MNDTTKKGTTETGYFDGKNYKNTSSDDTKTWGDVKKDPNDPIVKNPITK